MDVNITLLVMNGLICRSFYPNPKTRISEDKDIISKASANRQSTRNYVTV